MTLGQSRSSTRFTGVSTADGSGPIGLIQRSDGRLYGTTRSGGEFGVGTVYSIDLDGNYRIVHSFRSTGDGAAPGPDLLEASDGNLYGVTHYHAVQDRFERDADDPADLSGPSPGELIQGADGRLYGPTAAGGLDGGGTIITVDLAGTLTTFTSSASERAPDDQTA